MGEILIHAIVGLIEEASLFPERYWFVAGICLIWKLKKYTSDHRPNASTICTFYYKFLYQQIVSEKIAIKLSSGKIFGKKTSKINANKTNPNKKKSIKPKFSSHDTIK